MKLNHQSGMFDDTIKNMIKTLDALDGTTPAAISPTMHFSADTIRQRVYNAEMLSGATLMTRPQRGVIGSTWRLTEKGREVIAANAECLDGDE